MSLIKFDKQNHKCSYTNIAYYWNNHSMFYQNYPKIIFKGAISRIHPIRTKKKFSLTHPCYMYFV